MIFTSFTFLWFMVVVFAGYWLVRHHHRLQNLLLLVASYVFYGWVHPWFLILLAGSTVFDWACALAMDRWPKRRREWLIGSLIANLGLLGTFKYLGFFAESWEAAPHQPVAGEDDRQEPEEGERGEDHEGGNPAVSLDE